MRLNLSNGIFESLMLLNDFVIRRIEYNLITQLSIIKHFLHWEPICYPNIILKEKDRCIPNCLSKYALLSNDL